MRSPAEEELRQLDKEEIAFEAWLLQDRAARYYRASKEDMARARKAYASLEEQTKELKAALRAEWQGYVTEAEEKLRKERAAYEEARKAAGLELPRDREQEQERPREGPFVVCTYASAETQRQTSASRPANQQGTKG